MFPVLHITKVIFLQRNSSNISYPLIFIFFYRILLHLQFVLRSTYCILKPAPTSIFGTQFQFPQVIFLNIFCSQCSIYPHNIFSGFWIFVSFPVLHLTNVYLLQKRSSNIISPLIVTFQDINIKHFHFVFYYTYQIILPLPFYASISKFPSSVFD